MGGCCVGSCVYIYFGAKGFCRLKAQHISEVLPVSGVPALTLELFYYLPPLIRQSCCWWWPASPGLGGSLERRHDTTPRWLRGEVGGASWELPKIFSLL